MDITSPLQIRKELQSGVTIAEVCTKYNITFGKLCDIFHGYVRSERKEYGLPMYICPRPDDHTRFMIRRPVNGKCVYYGTYATVEDAVKVRDYLMVHGWYKNRVPKIRERLGV